MTQAVCIHCGSIKFGAFVQCPECGFQPSGDELMTSMALTDHYYSLDELKRMGKTIADGEQLVLGSLSPIDQAIQDHNRAIELSSEGDYESALNLARKAQEVFIKEKSEYAKQSSNLIKSLENREPIINPYVEPIIEFVNAETNQEAVNIAEQKLNLDDYVNISPIFDELIRQYSNDNRLLEHLENRKELLKKIIKRKIDSQNIG